MKIRNGFVSNSSSSSFVILGYMYDQLDENGILHHLGIRDENTKEIHNDVAEKILKEMNISILNSTDTYTMEVQGFKLYIGYNVYGKTIYDIQNIEYKDICALKKLLGRNDDPILLSGETEKDGQFC